MTGSGFVVAISENEVNNVECKKGSAVTQRDLRFDRLDADWALDEHRNPLAEQACQDVTRVVVVQNGVYTEYWAQSWRVDIQDGARTLKLFAEGDGSEAIVARNIALGETLGVDPDSAAAFAQAAATAEGQSDRFRAR